MKISANVKIAMERFENFEGENAPNAPPGCAPAVIPYERVLLAKQIYHCADKIDKRLVPASIAKLVLTIHRAWAPHPKQLIVADLQSSNITQACDL